MKRRILEKMSSKLFVCPSFPRKKKGRGRIRRNRKEIKISYFFLDRRVSLAAQVKIGWKKKKKAMRRELSKFAPAWGQLGSLPSSSPPLSNETNAGAPLFLSSQ